MEISLNSSEIEIIFKDEREDDTFNPEKALENFLNKNLDKFLLPLIPPPLEPKNGDTPKKGVDYFDGEDGKTPVKGIDYFTKKELSEIRKTIKEAILSEIPKIITEDEINVKFEDILKKIKNLPTGGGGALFLRQLMDVNVGNPTAQQYGLTYNPSRSEFSLTTITPGGLQSVVAGTNITIDDTDPQNPIISAIGDGTGTVTSVSTGTGLTGGPITTTGTVALNSSSIASLALADSALQAVPSGIDATKIADGSVNNTEFQYINSLTSNAQTQITARALDSAVVHNTGTETVAGSKTFSSDVLVPDEAYGAGWNGSVEVPTKNALYDKIESITSTPGGSDTQVQFNDAGTFGGDSAFIWNKTDNRLGIQATTPLNPLHVTSTVTETISPPASVTVTKVLETALAVPTGSATLEYMPLVATNPLTSETNVGAGYFTASLQTINYEIYAINTIDGVDYYVGATTATSYTDPSGDAHTFDVSVSWDSMTYADKYIVYNTSDNYYYDVGASTSMTDNGTGTAGGPTVQTGGGGILATGQTIDFVPVSRGSAPSGNSYYSADGTTYSITDSVNDSTHVFLINHSITGATSDTWTIKDTTNTLGYSGSGTSYVQVGLFGGDVDITVKHYGWLSNGTNLNRTYKVYSFKTSFYSATATENNTTDANDGLYYSISLSWTSVTGATTYKIFNKATGGAYANSKVQASPATDDVLDNAWAQATTITPSTGAAPITGRFDYPSANSATSNAQLAIVDTTGSGTRYSKISFGIATDSATEATYQTHIYSRSDNSSLHLAASSVIFLATPGGTETNTIGATNEFNKSKSGTAYTRIWSSVTANPAINVDNSTGQVSIFGTTGSANVGLMVRGQSNTAMPLVVRNFSASPGDHPFTVQSNVGGTLARVSITGAMQGTGLVGAPALSFTGDQDTGLYNPTTNVFGLVAGGAEQGRVSANGLSLKTTTNATDYLYFGAGTTALAPIRFTSGSLTTSSNIRVGQLQFLTDKLHFTITTGTAVKEITLNDTVLTSGRVPFATTNGRLTDDADFTFATDTLTVTKIAATTFTGNVTISTKNIVTDTTTGTKFGTATAQKIGFWNATPNIQPTTAIAAAAFVANTSGIVNDTATFGGYTMGQVVAALKQAGLLA